MVTGFFTGPKCMHADLCDFCGRDSLKFVYQPDGSTRGLKVHLCGYCGLVQSTPRIDRTKKHRGLPGSPQHNAT